MAKGRYQKRSGGAIVKAVVALMVAVVLAAGVCCIGYASRNDEGAWFRNSDLSSWHWGNKLPTADDDQNAPGITASTDGGMQIEPSTSSGLMALAVAYADEGEPAAQAESSYTLTATIEPADATNKVVDWSVSWENGTSSWASGKTVTNYVTITPTSDGALTARADCLQAFGEKITIKAQVRDSEDVFATCEVNYMQKYVGSKFVMNASTGFHGWDFTCENLNPVVDFPATMDAQTWALGLANTSFSSLVILSDIYTKTIDGVTGGGVDFAYTEAYLSALRAAQLTPKVNAEQYISLSTNSVTHVFFPDSDKTTIIIPSRASAWSAFKTSLRNNSDKVMIRVNCWITCNDGTTMNTIYNVKFSAASVAVIATDIKLDKPSIEF